MSAIQAFRALHAAPRGFVMPNAWDAGSAIVLTEAGFQVFCALDAYGAGEILQKRKLDLVILDFNMPAGTGDIVLKRVRESGQAATPILFVSAASVAEIKKKVPESESVRFLSKPIDFAQLKLTIAEMIAAAKTGP